MIFTHTAMLAALLALFVDADVGVSHPLKLSLICTDSSVDSLKLDKEVSVVLPRWTQERLRRHPLRLTALAVAFLVLRPWVVVQCLQHP